MKNRRGKKLNLVYFRKCKEKYVTRALERLPVFQAGSISVCWKPYQYTLKQATRFVAVSGVD